MIEVDQLSYNQVRRSSGWINRSGRAYVLLAGTDSHAWLQGMASNDVKRIENGASVIAACFLNPTGHILSEAALVNISSSTFLPGLILIDMPIASMPAIMDHLNRFIITEDVELTDVSDKVSFLSVQGPESESLLEKIDLPSSAICIPSDHTGSGGFDIYLPADQLKSTETIFTNISCRISSVIWNLLRVEAGKPEYGYELDETVIPLEAGLGSSHISFSKGCYIGQEVIARIHSRGHINRELTGFDFGSQDGLSPKEKVFEMDEGREVGRITSVVMDSPAADGHAIGLGYLRNTYRIPGLKLRIGETDRVAQVSEIPFYHKPSS